VILADVNVLLCAFRADTALHGVYRPWPTAVVNGAEPFGASPRTLSGVVRIATNPIAFRRQDQIGDVPAFANALLGRPHCRVVNPRTRHWGISCDLGRKANATGHLAQDA
jgi:uncharacterized protein